VPYLSTLEVCSRQGAIQIQVYLTLLLQSLHISLEILHHHQQQLSKAGEVCRADTTPWPRWTACLPFFDWGLPEPSHS